MAIRFTISGAFYPGFSASWNDPTIWSEGIVPTASDQAFIRGIRTTVNFASGYLPFFGTQSITVASTVGFPISGSFYTYTDRDEEIKLNYITCSATQFISASIDTGYYSWSYDVFPATQSLPSKLGGVIPNGAFVQFRPGTIYIDPSMGTITLTSSFTNPALTIENGGDVRMRSGSTLALGGYLLLNDGTFMMTGSGLFRFNNSYASASTETGVLRNINGIVANDQNLQYLIIEGDENRTNTTLSQSANIGDHYLTVNDVSGFEIKDEIFVGERNLTQSRTDNGFRSQYVGTFSSWDECFQIAGKDVGTNRLYVKRFKGIDAVIKATASSTELIVDGERFQVGDKVLINDELRTITQVTGSYDVLLKDYDFTTGSDLTDWTTDITRSALFSDWTLSSSYGLIQWTSTAYRHIFVRDTMLDNVKVEAWISNLRGITEGSASRNEYGVYIQSEPSVDSDQFAPTTTNQPLRTSFTIQPSFSRMYMRQKNIDNDVITNIYTGSYPVDGLKKITLEASKEFIKGYVDDTLIFDEYARAGSFWGRCGLYTNGNDAFVCTRYKIYNKFTKLTVDSPITVNIGDQIEETGIEYSHSPGHQVIKLNSTVIDPLEFKDLAFAYRGAEEYQTDPTLDSGSFPYIWGTNSSGSTNFDWFRFTLNVGDYATNYALGVGFTRSVILDFNKPIEFNRVGFLENFLTIGQSMTASRGIQFSGSNDIIGAGIALTASNWTPLTSSIVDSRRRTNIETFRSFNVGGPHTYRFLRIETQGLTQATTTENTFRSFRIRLNYSNSIQLNNTSDLNIGDEIALISRYNLNPISDITNYSSLIFPSSSLTTASFLDNFTQHYTIISKSAGNVIYLNQPFEEGTPEKGDTVIKLNRSLKFSGSFNSSSRDWDVGRIAVLGSATARFVRRIKFENTSFQHLTGQFPQVGTTAVNLIYSGFGLGEQNWYNYMGLVQGCTFYNNYNMGVANSGMYWPNRSGFATRHCLISGFQIISLNGNGNPNFQAPIISTGNIIYGITTQTGLPINFSQTIYSYNLVYGGNIPLPGAAGYQAVYTTPYNSFYLIKRNHIEGVTGTVAYSQNLDSFGTQYSIIIDSNRIGFVHQNAGVFFMQSFLDKGFKTPFLLPRRGGFDGRRLSLSLVNAPLQSYITSSYGGPSHNIPVYIKNHNRQGFDLFLNNSGIWIKPENDPYYKFYKQFTQVDWRNPILGAYLWLDEGVSASFDVNFDYYVTPSIEWQSELQYSGSLYMIVLKNGGELSEQFTLPKVTTPTNFSRTFSLTGSGHFQIALAGLNTQHGYAAFANISSRLVAPNTDQVQVFSNNFNLRYFNNLDQTMAKTMYNQTPTDPLFRLKGARIF
jgi:hypothetical protein